jgi:hypothetical protein
MKISITVAVVAFCLFAVCQVVPAGEKGASHVAQGEELVRQLWADMKARNIEGLEKKLAPGFQSVHSDGARSREQEIELLKDLDLGEYTLSNLTVSQTGAVIVAVYFVSVEETIEGKRLSSVPAPRMSVFLETEDGWKWMAHANLKPLK